MGSTGRESIQADGLQLLLSSLLFFRLRELSASKVGLVGRGRRRISYTESPELVRTAVLMNTRHMHTMVLLHLGSPGTV